MITLSAAPLRSTQPVRPVATSRTPPSRPTTACVTFRSVAQVRRYKRHTRYLEIAILVAAAGFALAELRLAG